MFYRFVHTGRKHKFKKEKEKKKPSHTHTIERSVYKISHISNIYTGASHYLPLIAVLAKRPVLFRLFVKSLSCSKERTRRWPYYWPFFFSCTASSDQKRTNPFLCPAFVIWKVPRASISARHCPPLRRLGYGSISRISPAFRVHLICSRSTVHFS